MAGTVAAGAVWDAKPEDWWVFSGPPGTYRVTLVSSYADADLGVGDTNCNPKCAKSNPIGLDECTVTVDTHGVTVVAQSRSHDGPASYVIDVALVRPAAAPDCADGVDNDGDGFKDWGNDSGCESPADPSEDDSPCYDVANVAVCVETLTTGRGESYPSVHVRGKEHEIAGYVETYEFDVAGEKVRVPCVVLVVNPHATANPCKTRAGRFVSRDMPLFTPVRQDLPTGGVRLTTFRVCPAIITVTVGATPSRSFPAYTLC